MLTDCLTCQHFNRCEQTDRWDVGCINYKMMPTRNPTNADRVRGMTDEQLAGWFDKLTNGCDLCPIRRNCELGVESFGRCDDKWLAWLKSPVKDGAE